MKHPWDQQNSTKQMMLFRPSQLAIFMLVTNTAVNSYAGEGMVSVVSNNGERISIEKSSVVLTPIYKNALYSELKTKEEKHQSMKLQYEECRRRIDAFYCWQMYGDEISTAKQKIPRAMLRIAFDPLYVVISYRPVVSLPNNKKKIGGEAFVVCLNPNVPSGYWNTINQYKPILKYSPSTTDNPRPKPSDALKYKACKAFAMFN